MIRNKHILVAVLNWGLGHATRSIPIIQKLLNDQNIITLASDGAALTLLRLEFPELSTVELSGYNVRYPSSSMIWNIGTQLPKISKAIRTEQRIVGRWVENNKTDIIISDNRYGCHHPSVENIFISHQINLQVPFSSIVNQLHARMIHPFKEIWIIDDDDRTLSGKLSDPKWILKNITVKYVGAQSQLQKVHTKKKHDIAVILSGPEPQRTFLENEILEKLGQLNLKTILVQGSKMAKIVESSNQVEVIQFAEKEELSQIICSSEMMICRSGYSTIMDLSKLGGHALFIPTPGQTEQIYLAQRLKDRKLTQYQTQGNIDIQMAWSERSNFKGFG